MNENTAGRKSQITFLWAQFSHPRSLSLETEMKFLAGLPVNFATLTAISASEQR